LRNERTGLIVASVLELASESASRNKGLLGRASLSENHAFILAPANVVHTFFMQFAIDLLFVSRKGEVLKLRTAVPAWRIAGQLRAFAVIELAAHALERSGTRVGDTLTVVTA
jgi:uncharacterized membrane protein (UPF0127 family)